MYDEPFPLLLELSGIVLRIYLAISLNGGPVLLLNVALIQGLVLWVLVLQIPFVLGGFLLGHFVQGRLSAQRVWGGCDDREKSGQ